MRGQAGVAVSVEEWLIIALLIALVFSLIGWALTAADLKKARDEVEYLMDGDDYPA